MPDTDLQVSMSPEEHAAWLEFKAARERGPALYQAELPSIPWKERLFTWRHQGLAVNVLVWTVLALLMQRVGGTVSREQLLETFTTVATALGYASPGALGVAAWSALNARGAN